MSISRRVFSKHLLTTLSLGSLGSTNLITGCSTLRANTLRQSVLSGNTVLALGDSLTYGSGAPKNASYPAVLSRITGWNVINAGIPGNYSYQALARLPRLLDRYKPALVLTCIGINDFANNVPIEVTHQSLIDICKLVDSAFAQHLLIAAPYVQWPLLAEAPLLTAAPVYQEVATQMQVPLNKYTLSHVLSHAEMRSDNLHANAKGYAYLARGVAQSLHHENILLYNQDWDDPLLHKQF